MPPKKQPPSITQNVTGDNNIVIAGNKNTVNVIQKFFNIFKSDAETVDQRNRRIMLGHVGNFWVKGILEKSLHGAALLDLGIKEDPDALNYPWAIKREANKETLPVGTSMLEIFQEIGMGRSLLILGAPGSGKTTMLLELTRQLIERAREDVTEPIPVVFNLSSWTEKLTLADWLARELNVIYTIPKKVVPTWVSENKMLLLLDGLDEVKQESRDKCVDAINQFRKENGLTSMAVCSRIQDYAELDTRLSFDGAIEIQPLTSNQVNKYFKRFGKGLAGIRQVLEKDTVLREMAETPLFLDVMIWAYRDTESKDILVTENFDIQRKHLFDKYIERMFERPERSKNEMFKKHDVLRWLSWLAQKIIEHNQIPFLLENMQSQWLGQKKQGLFRLIAGLIVVLIGGLIGGLIGVLTGGLSSKLNAGRIDWMSDGLLGLVMGMIAGLVFGLSIGLSGGLNEIHMVDALTWDWKQVRRRPVINGLKSYGLMIGLITWLIFGLFYWLNYGLIYGLCYGPIIGLFFGLIGGLAGGLTAGLSVKQLSRTTYPGQRISFSISNFLIIFMLFWLFFSLLYGIFFLLIGGWTDWLDLMLTGLVIGVFTGGLIGGLRYGGFAVIQHYSLRFSIACRNYLPFRLIPFLDHCVDLIFLRRVGGGYIFVHRLLMEHFAAMYPASDK